MAAHISAGLLMYRKTPSLEFFLVHPGGPYFKKKMFGVWSIPKGLPENNEDLLIAAQREFREETGIIPIPPFDPLGSIQQRAGKIVHAWSFAGNWDAGTGITCNTFSMEWPPRSGRFQEFPEQDKAEWMRYEKATEHIIPEQIPLLDRAIALYS